MTEIDRHVSKKNSGVSGVMKVFVTGSAPRSLRGDRRFRSGEAGYVSP